MPARTLVIEQVNAAEDSMAAQYETTIDSVSFNDFVLKYPRGAYTGMRTVNRDAIVEFDSHVKRLCTSLSLMKFGGANNETESPKATTLMASFRNIEKLKQKLVPMLAKGLKTFHDEIDPTSSSDHPWETKVSVMIAYSAEKEVPCFAAHFSALAAPISHRVKVEVEHKSRSMPVVKDSQWVRDRAPLEQGKLKDVNEVLLIDDAGRVYEGMSSNFFAVRVKEDGSPVLVTAPLEHVLLGTVMKIVMAVCEQHRIPIEWTFPCIQDARAGKWEGCFLTSTSRLLLPIETIYAKDGSAAIEFPHVSDTVEMLRQQVRKEISSRAYKIL
ncbi:hypothetical protein VTP01DRAFT_5417 [Rhizomucor pusillus]|uniref:uncharacterized protein n=1 Tax=Rhizomucor pusillus TaxID=4840 RepID=UPI0037438F14